MFIKSTKPDLLAEGQVLIIAARWVLIVLGLFLTLLDTRSVSFNTTRFEVMVILLLALSNFYLVSQVLTKQKTLRFVVYGAGLFDIVVVTLIIIVQGGFASNAFTFYFPALLAFSLVFPTLELYFMLGATLSLYGLVCLFSLDKVDDLQVLVVRIIMLAAVAICGHYFASIEQKRRNAVLQAEIFAPATETAESRPQYVA
jgi:hypothetical protein